ncbi:MAG TPA: hypothetical protein VH761_01170 [Ilumatobacteraceae bacterium]|jgi:hypothetical protein
MADYALQNAAPQPTLQQIVRDEQGRRARLVVFSGVVSVAPAQQRGIVVRTTVEQPGAPVGFYVPEAFGLPVEGAVAVAEATPTQIVIDGRTQMATAYGVSDVAVRLVESEQTPGKAWPYLSFTCHSNDLALSVHYRVTIQYPMETPTSTTPAARNAD